MVAVLFVCLGNICRSPAGEAVLMAMAEKDTEITDLHVESCGLGSWHIGMPADERMRSAAKERGVNLCRKGQRFHPGFFDRFDYILAADFEILEALHKAAVHSHHKAKIHLMTAFSEVYHKQEVPDPYYGGDAGFEHVLDMLEDACEGILKHIKAHPDQPKLS